MLDGKEKESKKAVFIISYLRQISLCVSITPVTWHLVKDLWLCTIPVPLEDVTMAAIEKVDCATEQSYISILWKSGINW